MLLAAVLAFALAGCGSLPPVEFCYIHPVYGQVCVRVGGKLHYSEDLTPAQREEVRAWVKAKDAE